MAQHDLIIMVFGQSGDAFLARQALEMMREQHLFGLEYSTEVTCDSAGRMVLHHRWELPAHAQAGHRRLPSLLSAAIFGHTSENGHRPLTDAGLDEFFLTKVSEALVPNSSALLIFVPYDSTLIDVRALMNVIALLKGTVHRTSVPQEIEQTLLGNLHQY